MAKEKTLSIIKPNSVRKNQSGAILAKLEDTGLKIINLKMVHLEREAAESFYNAHKGKPFFEELVNFMISGPIVVSVLEGEGAVQLNRDIMGSTNPSEAAPDTIRAIYADSMTENSVHGSDSVESANIEIAFFFNN